MRLREALLDVTSRRETTLRAFMSLAIAFTVPVVPARSQTAEAVVWNARYESPRMNSLATSLAKGDQNALARFWREIDGKAPLIEPVGNDSRDCWVTFVWRGNSKTQKVGLLGDLPYADRAKWYMTRLAGTDVWFKTERFPRDARFGYLINENDASQIRSTTVIGGGIRRGAAGCAG